MLALRRIAVVVFCLLFGAAVRAGDGSRSLDSVDNGKSGDQNAADTETSESLDAAEVAPPASAAPPPVPEIADLGMRAQAKVAHAAAVGAGERFARADAAYSEMMTRSYPQGDARLAIVNERDAARQAYAQASAVYAKVLQGQPQSGNAN